MDGTTRHLALRQRRAAGDGPGEGGEAEVHRGPLGTGRQAQTSMFDRFRDLAVEIHRSGMRVVPLRDTSTEVNAIAWGFPHEFKGFERKAIVMFVDKNISLDKSGNVRARLVILREEAAERLSDNIGTT